MSKKKNLKPKKPRYKHRMRGHVPMLERKRREEQSNSDRGIVSQETLDYKFLAKHFGIPTIDSEDVHSEQGIWTNSMVKIMVRFILASILTFLVVCIGMVLWNG